MTSRERLLNAVLRKPVDRIPISTYELVPYGGGWPNDDPSYASLMDFIREHTDVMKMWGPRSLGGGLGYFVSATQEANAEHRSWPEGESTHHEVIIHTPKGPLRHRSRTDPHVHTAWAYERFVKNDEDIERVLSVPYVPNTCDASGMSVAVEELGDAGIPLISIGDPVCNVSELFRFEDFMERAFTDRASIERLLDAFFPRVYDWLRQMLEQGVGPLFRICGPEYVTPPYLPPELFRAFVVKYTQPLIELIHQHACYARVHCHGRFGRVMEMIAEMGADATDPVEPPPLGDATLAEVRVPSATASA